MRVLRCCVMGLRLSWALAVAACGPTADGALAPNVIIERLPDGEVSMVSPSGLFVDDRDWIYVADQSPARVIVLNQQGAFVRVVGREGHGPGEFRVAVPSGSAGIVTVFDPELQRLTQFDDSARLRWMVAAPCCRYSRITVDRRGRTWVPAPARGGAAGWDAAIGFDSTGRARDTVDVPGSVQDPSYYWTLRDPGEEAARFSTRIPLKPANYYAISRTGQVWHGFSSAAVIAQGTSGRDRNQVAVISRPRQSVSDAARASLVERLIAGWAKMIPEATLRELVHVADVPTSLPWFFDLATDACDHLWVLRTPLQLAMPAEFDIFGPEGTPIGVVHLPVSADAVEAWAVGNAILAVVTTSATGDPIVARWRFGLPSCAAPSGS